MHTLLDAGAGALRNAEQLDPIAELVGGCEILEGDRLDAFDMHGLGVDLGAKSKAGEDRKLMGSVEATDVKCGIGFGIAEPLRFLQASRKRQPLLVHTGEDIVAGAVEN